ncbi:MAG: FAD binding domain-containing protein [Spirochaetales bacterium]|nr:FAD binding domain-containing protein [Spirochaetales bacterium]
MYEGVKAAAVHNPSSLAELVLLRNRLPGALLWAGGTAIMSKTRLYPASDGIDIIYLGNVQELKRISRSERYLEIGSQVSIEQILRVGQHILHPVFAGACRESGPYVIRSQATIGGSLSLEDYSLNIPTALSVLESQVEIRNPENKKPSTQWIPVHRMFSRNRERSRLQPAIITRVRIQLEEGDFEFFNTVGEPYLNPDEAVILSVFAKYNLPAISEYRFALSFPLYGIFRSREIETAVSINDLPFEQRDISRIIRSLREDLQESSFPISPLQRERACRVFEYALHRMNSQSIK